MASPYETPAKFSLAILLSILCLLLIVVLINKGFQFPLGYDEAYNLQVVDSLAHGRGYASFGALRGQGLWPFDPYITTGPAILGPLAVIWAITGGSIVAARVFMASFLFVYLAALLAIAGQTRDRLMSGVLAVSAALSMNLLQLGQAPGEVAAGAIGELPASAALAWSVFFVMRNRLFWAALCVGLAIQMKVVFIAPGLVVLGFGVGKRWIFGPAFRRGEVAASALLAGAPSLLFEIYRFLSLGGVAAYFRSIAQFFAFVRAQTISNGGTWLDASILGTKIVRLYQTTPRPAWFALALACAMVLVLPGLALDAVGRHEGGEPAGAPARGEDHVAAPGASLALASMMIAGLALLAGWLTQSAQLSERQGLPFLLLFAPALVVQSRCVALRLGDAFPKFGATTSGALLVATSVLYAFALFSQIRALQSQDWATPMAEQRRVAGIVADARPSSLFVDKWWQNPEIQLLAKIGAVPVRTKDRQILIVPPYQVPRTEADLARQKKSCQSILYSSADYLVCWLQ